MGVILPTVSDAQPDSPSLSVVRIIGVGTAVPDTSYSQQDVLERFGFQEAILLTLRALFAGPGDVLLVVQPCFVGAVGAARVLGIETWPVDEGSEGVDLVQLKALCGRARSQGKRVRAVYVAPDYSNPSGTVLCPHHRQALLEAAACEDFLLLKDATYGFAAPDGSVLPSLKALDRAGRASISVPSQRSPCRVCASDSWLRIRAWPEARSWRTNSLPSRA